MGDDSEQGVACEGTGDPSEGSVDDDAARTFWEVAVEVD